MRSSVLDILVVLVILIILLMASVLATKAYADPSGPAQPWRTADRARLVGVLDATIVAVDFDATPARDAFAALSRALEVPVMVRYPDRTSPYGVDPDAPITLRVDRGSARFVLELLVEATALFDPLTWQLRRGFIEVGPKERLGVPAAMETRMYPIRDQMIEPPYFAPAGHHAPSLGEFYAHPYRSAALVRPLEPNERKRPEEIAVELAATVCETIEPGNWDYGQDDEAAIPITPEEGPTTPGAVPRSARPRRAVPSFVLPRKMARMRVYRDQLVVDAPDFIHRQIDGDPPPIAPPPLTEVDRAARSARASGATWRVEVLGQDDLTGRAPSAFGPLVPRSEPAPEDAP